MGGIEGKRKGEGRRRDMMGWDLDVYAKDVNIRLRKTGCLHPFLTHSPVQR